MSDLLGKKHEAKQRKNKEKDESRVSELNAIVINKEIDYNVTEYINRMVFKAHPGADFHQRSKTRFKGIIKQTDVIYTRIEIMVVDPVICWKIPSTHNNECHKDIKRREVFVIYK